MSPHPRVGRWRWTALILVLLPAVAPAESGWESFARYEWPRILSERGGPDYHLVAALVTTLPDVGAWKPAQFYTAALDARPADPLTLYSTATWCFYEPEQSFCFDRDLLEELRARDPDNGIPLMMLAVRALVARQDDEALAFLQAATQRARLDGYWGQMVGVLRRTIRDTVPEHFGDPGTLAVGIALARPQVEVGIHDVCTSPGAKLLERRWNRVCLELGRALEERGTTLMLAQMGLSMQRRILKLEDDGQALAELDRRAERLDALRQAHAPAVAGGERYWSDLELYGEVEALRRAAAALTPVTPD